MVHGNSVAGEAGECSGIHKELLTQEDWSSAEKQINRPKGKLAMG